MNAPQPIVDIARSTPARIGLAVESLDDGEGFSLRADEIFPQASAIKIPILWELHRAAAAGELALTELTPIEPTNGAGGCGVLQNFAPLASQLALGDLAVLMIVLSDNVATNQLIDRLGFDAVNALLESLGATQTRLRRKMIDPAARRAGRENTSTPAEAATLMRRLGEAESSGDPIAAATMRVLRLRKESPVTAALPKEARLATKPGMLEGLRTEWSLVDAGGVRYAMALMGDGAEGDALAPLFQDLAGAVHAAMIAE